MYLCQRHLDLPYGKQREALDIIETSVAFGRQFHGLPTTKAAGR